MLNSEALLTLLRRAPLLYVDAGARGDLEGDWRNFPKDCLSVLAFEPDEKAVIDWENAESGRYVERSALWSSETDVKIHIGTIGSTSSVWPPNMEYLARFARRHVDPRVTQSIAQVRARPLDTILSERQMRADFLKIDTQGAELQILQGSRHALEASILGGVVETWTVPVHQGQGLTHEVMALMQGHGFIICQIETAAAWDRKIVERDNVPHRRQIVGLDILFMRDPPTIKDRLADPVTAAKYAAIAQMYGHYDLALEAIDIAIAGGRDISLLKTLRGDILGAYVAMTNPPTPARTGILGKIRNRLFGAPAQQDLPAETKLHY
jgi:FkbM family methyltransferase